MNLSFSAAHYEAPAQNYAAPAPTYGAPPAQSYAAPAHSYAPAATYGAPGGGSGPVEESIVKVIKIQVCNKREKYKITFRKSWASVLA